jgi:hypothetical protein
MSQDEARARRFRVFSSAIGWLIAGVFAAATVLEWIPWVAQGGDGTVGMDFVLYRDAAQRWLSGGPFYQPYQLAGPYVVSPGDILYPPPTLILFAPFTVLPAVLWWAIPLVVTGWLVWWHRPSPLAWAGIAIGLWFPTTGVTLVHGNPFLWAAMAVALSTRWHWPGVFVVLKPTLLPFAAINLRNRSWWIALGGLVVLCLPFAAMWPDYITVLRNAKDPSGIAYSLGQFPYLAVPVFAWLGSTRRIPGLKAD